MNLTQCNFIIILLGLVYMFNFIPSAFAQDQNSWVNVPENTRKIHELDGLLSSTTAATLTGLSLAGASFLVRSNVNDDNTVYIDRARKYFIKSFWFFMSCLISIFIFDTLEILFQLNTIISFLDIVISYGLFGMGSYGLVKGARGIYDSYVTKKSEF